MVSHNACTASSENPLVAHAVAEPLELLLQYVFLLLAHRPAQHVRAPHGEPGDPLGDLHDLLLVHDQAVGLGEDVAQRLGQLRVDRLDLLPAVLAVGVVVVRVHRHRARPVQGVDGDDVLEAGRPHPPQQVAHGAAVELEHAQRVAAGEQFVGVLVVGPSVSRSTVSPRLASMLSIASPMTVRLRSPRKSIFSRPMASHDG